MKKYNPLEIAIIILQEQDVITGSQTFDEDKDVTGNDIYNGFWE